MPKKKNKKKKSVKTGPSKMVILSNGKVIIFPLYDKIRKRKSSGSGSKNKKTDQNKKSVQNKGSDNQGNDDETESRPLHPTVGLVLPNVKGMCSKSIAIKKKYGKRQRIRKTISCRSI